MPPAREPGEAVGMVQAALNDLYHYTHDRSSPHGRTEVHADGIAALATLQARLAEYEREYDTVGVAALIAQKNTAERRLAKVEAERDEVSLRNSRQKQTIEALRMRAKAAEQRVREWERGLQSAYHDFVDPPGGLVIAKLCDEYLDRSGALLGRVRRAPEPSQ